MKGVVVVTAVDTLVLREAGLAVVDPNDVQPIRSKVIFLLKTRLEPFADQLRESAELLRKLR